MKYMAKKMVKLLKVTVVILISTEISALEEISKMCGEVKSKEKEKTSSTPLVTVSDLQRLEQWETIILRLRTMPFKTKLTPNFNMDWGHNFPRAGYPKREKTKIKVFDLKGFVEPRREAKLNSMLGGIGGGRSGMPGIPGMSGLPGMPGMTGMPGIPGGTDFNRKDPFPKKDKPNGGIDVDELVKRIDAKIAELEAEEAAEKENNKKAENKEAKKPVVEAPIVKESTDEVKEIKPEVKVDAKTISKSSKSSDDITEDQFFDDFFNDAD